MSSETDYGMALRTVSHVKPVIFFNLCMPSFLFWYLKQWNLRLAPSSNDQQKRDPGQSGLVQTFVSFLSSSENIIRFQFGHIKGNWQFSSWRSVVRFDVNGLLCTDLRELIAAPAIFYCDCICFDYGIKGDERCHGLRVKGIGNLPCSERLFSLTYIEGSIWCVSHSRKSNQCLFRFMLMIARNAFRPAVPTKNLSQPCALWTPNNSHAKEPKDDASLYDNGRYAWKIQ